MESPVIAACIAAATAVIIAAAQIINQWFLAIRSEKKVRENSDVPLDELNRSLRKLFLTPKLILSAIFQLAAIALTTYMLDKQAISMTGVLIISVQVATLLIMIATSWTIAFCIVSLRYALTGR